MARKVILGNQMLQLRKPAEETAIGMGDTKVIFLTGVPIHDSEKIW
jgi:hypothetical protein